MKVRKIRMNKAKIAMLGRHPAAFHLTELLREQGHEVDHLQGWDMLPRLLGAGQDYSLYHAHNVLSTVAMKMASWVTRVPSLSHVHDFAGKAALAPLRWLERVVYRETRFTTQVSSTEAFAKLKNVNAVQTLLPGVNAQAFEAVKSEKKAEQFNVLYSGPLVKSKGLFELLQAAHQLVHSTAFIQSHRDFKLHFVGAGPQKSALEKKALTLGLQKYVKFHGKLRGEKRIARFKEMDLFVLPSLSDGLPFELLAAAAARLPLLASEVGDVRKLVQENQTGHLVPAGDVKELAYYLEYFALNPHLASMGDAAFELVATDFQEEGFLEQMRRIYDALLNGKKAQKERAVELMPWEIPRVWLQSRRFNVVRSSKAPLRFCFTLNLLQNEADMPSFLSRFQEFTEQLDIRSTIFVQSDQLEALQEQLQNLQNMQHEIGVHALQSDWQDRPTRRKSLRRMREEQAELGISPRMFRAPQAAQHEDLGILHEHGYEFLPVSTDPKPRVQWQGALPYGHQPRMNLKNFLEMSDQDMLAAIHRLRNIQAEHELDPYIIFECSSWEFQSQEAQAYASGENFSKLAQKIAFLKENMDLEFSTLSQFCASLEAITQTA